jgi:YVTN family beta-propeller protein
MSSPIRKCLLFMVCALVTLAARASPFAYIADEIHVTVIDVATNAIVTTITVGSVPEGVAVNPAGTRVYITNSVTPGTVSVIDTATNTVIATIPVGNAPFGVAVNPAGTRAYVANFSSGTVSVIDTATNAVVTTIPALTLASGVAINPAGTRVYVATSSGLAVIDAATNTVITTIPGASSLGLVVNPAGTFVYSSNGSAGKVIDTATNTVVATITMPTAGGSLQGIGINPAGTRVYYTDTNNASVYVVDTATNTAIATVPVGTSPEGVDVTPDGSHVYVANSGSASVSVISTASNTVVATVPTPGVFPFAFGKFFGTPPAGPGAGTLQFSAATYSVGEAGGSVTITVTRVGGSTGAVGASFATSDGTATAGSDYTAASGTLSWADGDSAPKTFVVPILQDALVEGNETVNLTLSAPTGGATLGAPSTAVLTIVDDDAPVVIGQPIPTVADWALVALAAMLLVTAMTRFRKRR